MNNKENVNVVVGIIVRDNKILVAQRPHGKPYSGFWEFPGGKIEKNETSKKALAREIFEELGIHIVEPKFLFKHTHLYPDKKALLDLWLITQFRGTPENKENQILRWIFLEELPKLNMLEGNIAILEKISSRLKNICHPCNG